MIPRDPADPPDDPESADGSGSPGAPDPAQTGRPDDGELPAPLTPPARPDDGSPPSPPARPGAGTFTIEGRAAPGLFVVGWLASLIGVGAIFVAFQAGGDAAPVLLLIGLAVLSIGLIAGAGGQGIERRARGRTAYLGPSPLLVFAASVPVSLILLVIVGVPMDLLGIAFDGPVGRLASVVLQAIVYVGLLQLLVVDTRALRWSEMGIRAPDRRTIPDLLGGALWALPVIIVTIPIAAVLAALLPVTPVSPLPPTGEASGFVIQFIAGAIVAPIGEELMFRAFATTAWLRDLGERRALLRGALFFAVVHVLTISGNDAGDALGLAIVGFATRVPVALALGWLFLRRGTIWAPIGLHATFNAILLTLGELATTG